MDENPHGQPLEIPELTRRISRGDESAFREFHEAYFSRLHRFLLAVSLGNEEEAAEALQQTMLRVARHVRPFADEATFWSWLKTVARNAARDGGRKQTRYQALLRRFAASDPTPEWSAEEESAQHALEASLDDLKDLDRELVNARYFSQLCIADIAKQTGLTGRAVESRLARIRDELRAGILKKLRTL